MRCVPPGKEKTDGGLSRICVCVALRLNLMADTKDGNPRIWLVRHGETEWSSLGRHTGRTDIPLTAIGEQQAGEVASLLNGRSFSLALTSPLQRARETARLVGFPQAEIDNDLAEWDYGVYEGRTTLDIRKQNSAWSIWTADIVNGESLEQVASRADRVIERALDSGGETIVFAHGHLLRILAACWIKLPPQAGRMLYLSTASISILGWERATRVLQLWNRAEHSW